MRKGPAVVKCTVTIADAFTWFSTVLGLSEVLVFTPWILQLDDSLTKILWIYEAMQQKLFLFKVLTFCQKL